LLVRSLGLAPDGLGRIGWRRIEVPLPNEALDVSGIDDPRTGIGDSAQEVAALQSANNDFAGEAESSRGE